MSAQTFVTQVLGSSCKQILHEKALKMLIAFLSSYSCKMGVSALAFMKDKYRNRLDAEHPMRLALSDVEPQFQKLVKVKWRYTLCNKISAFCVLFFFCLWLFVSIKLGPGCF